MSDDVARLKQAAFVLARVTELTVALGAADGEADDAHLRIEVLESHAAPGHYRARIYRLSFFRQRPSFPQREGEPRDQSDERLWAAFDSFNCPLETPQRFADADVATDHVLAALARWLNPA